MARKRSRKEIKAIKAKGKPYKVGPLFEPKETAKGNFLSGDAPNAIGGTRPLLSGADAVSEGKHPIAKGKRGVLGAGKLHKGADEK